MRKSRRQIWEAIGAGARIELDVNLEERGTFFLLFISSLAFFHFFTSKKNQSINEFICKTLVSQRKTLSMDVKVIK